MPSIDDFRAQFPVLQNIEYLNAGTEGPMPTAAIAETRDKLEEELPKGRSGGPHWEELERIREQLRTAYASLLNCSDDEVALTYSTGDGLGVVFQGFDFREGDEILTTDEEHFGLLGPAGLIRRERGVTIRMVPFDDVHRSVGPQTKLIACSHVAFRTGQVMDVAALTGLGVPVLVDGAQALGAIEVDVKALGVDYYAAPGQKWLCGPDGTGCLYVRRDHVDELLPMRAHYFSLQDAGRAPELSFREGARKFDLGVPQGALQLWALKSFGVLEEAGWPWVLERGPRLAQHLVDRLTAEGIEVVPRGPSTLVAFADPKPLERVPQLADARYAVRDIPTRPHLRASVGAWSSEEALDDFVDTVVRLQRA
jgi:selenocysteine lyase/cysteine desulfurase